ncbi:MAG: DUF4442 domain-containing protein [Bacteroidales bacterium]|nr:DUF4442 domain-containing protein [Bacteroidales bacterium]
MENTKELHLKKTSLVGQLVASPLKFKLYLMQKLPLALVAGLRVEQFNGSISEVSVPYKFINKNPFHSVYFAPLSMAAELSSGLLAMDAVSRSPVPVSMLVLEMKAEFIKKAKTRIRFKSTDGDTIAEAVLQCVKGNEGRTVVVATDGLDDDGNLVARFWFTWTFKRKQ